MTVVAGTGTSADSGFTMAGGPDFVRRGLAGNPLHARSDGTGLILTAQDGRVLSIPIEQVECLRLGTERSRHLRYYMARLFLVGEDRPLLIMPAEGQAAGYAVTMRRFAHAVAEVRGLACVERGLTKARMVFFIVLFSLLALAASTVLLLFASGDGLAGPLLFAAAMAAVIALYASIAVRTEMPRSVASLDEIERFLPA